MGRTPCCAKVGLRKGRWTVEEDEKLIKHIQANGEGSWRSLPKNAGLLRCGKSCRLRWINYLRDDLKRGDITPEEEKIIIELHGSLGNRWSVIAGHLPGRTDNEIKNYWNSHLSRRIHTYRRFDNEGKQVIVHVDKMVGVYKRRPGRTSRAAMKKNIIHSEMKDRRRQAMNRIETNPGAVSINERNSVENIKKRDMSVGLSGLNDILEREAWILDPSEASVDELLKSSIENDKTDIGESVQIYEDLCNKDSRRTDEMSGVTEERESDGEVFVSNIEYNEYKDGWFYDLMEGENPVSSFEDDEETGVLNAKEEGDNNRSHFQERDEALWSSWLWNSNDDELHCFTEMAMEDYEKLSTAWFLPDELNDL